jgi:calcineurin-like phosphoesterase family protein
MFNLEESIAIAYEKDDNKLGQAVSSIISDDSDEDKFNEFPYLLQIRKFFIGKTSFQHRKIAEIAQKISHGTELLAHHLKLIPISNDYFKVVNALHLLSPCDTSSKDEHNLKFEKIILHLSDLHFGPNNKYQQKTLVPDTPKSNGLDVLIKDIAKTINRQVDFVIISGDLTCSSEPNEFNAASEFLVALSSKLNIQKEKILIVPGNHDIKWTNPTSSTPETQSELNYSNFLQVFYQKKAENFFCNLAFDEHIALLGLNSIRIEPRMHGIGYIGDDQLDYAFESILKDHRDKILIACAHHHILPVNAIEPISEGKNVSLMADAKLVADRLLEEKAILYLHGHMHTPFFSVLRRINGDIEANQEQELFVFSAGSLSAVKEKIDFFGRNHYNIYKISNNSIETFSRYTSDTGHGFSSHKIFREWYEKRGRRE